MPHKVSTLALLDVRSPAVQIAGACNAVRRIDRADALVVGAGGVGSAIAASLAEAGAASIGRFDTRADAAEQLAHRLRSHHPALQIRTRSNDPGGFDIAVNATPLGMKSVMTPFPTAAAERGCRFQTGLDMLFEQIPASLAFFGFPDTTPEMLRSVARLE